jgi:propanol-preferring alcohol dehydrogenase
VVVQAAAALHRPDRETAMRAMVLQSPSSPLVLTARDPPSPSHGEVLVRVRACGVCRTDLHVADGDLPQARYPIVPGHEIVGLVEDVGPDVGTVRVGDRVGIPWLASTCGQCRYCREGRENLCEAARFTGCSVDGGYADYALADARFCFRLPAGYSDEELAPWLCAGLIGYRALRMAGEARRLGLYGFGAAAHLLAQLCASEGRDVFAFTRPDDAAAQALARSLGAVWAGGSDTAPPQPLDAAILFAPIGSLVPKALRDVVRGGSVVCAGIHMSDIPAFPYAALWGERHLCSVSNLTRRDGVEFLDRAARAGIRSHVTPFPLTAANEALAALRDGALTGAAVLLP